ncbi:uncharacterized protein [Rutidosis leptorrhynchoides]|uniref:uncharacterized protein n=1 Tax=Rutidosis leptorrhynchoides TaxID=125765 RepID=UPI003A990222
MTVPKTVKEVQSLTGKLAAFTRFLSKAAERQLPFFKTLKDYLKQKSFLWTSEAETAFQEMKKLLKTLPKLTAPIKGKTLYLYISVANEAFGLVLIAERDKIQKPVYFVSKALAGSEVNYAPIEKFVYALILTSRRLRMYFQGHPVHVLTNMPIKQVLTKPEIYGRLALWAVELGAYEISYLPRNTIKGQVLADYLAETSEGACGGVVLASPSSEEHTYALRFNFEVTNNEAEYEALLAGLNIAHTMNVIKLHAFTYSQIVENQFSGCFDAHDPSMQKYLKLLQELAVRFEHFELAQVPRSQNKKADALSKLAALTFSHFQKQVWVEELPSKSIDNDLMVASVEKEQPNWMEPILQYIRNNILPNDKREAHLVRERAPMYIIQNDILYRKSYCGPMMRCVGPIEVEMIVDEVHNGSCALHSGYKTIAAKIMLMGYFWPSLYRDVAKIVKRCKSCQRHALQNRLPRHNMIPVNSPWPFHNWVDELPNVLWAHRTTFKKSIGETPFSLVYGSEAVIPAEILVPTHRVANLDEEANGETLCENLNLIEERRLMAAIREANNKQQITKYYNKRLRALSLDVGEWVLRNNDASRAEKLGKLGLNWEGPYQVVAINAAGSYKLADIEGRNLPNAWLAALLKQYYA